jgi:hypothetical protein
MPDLPTSMSVSPLTARKTWRTVEPLHGMIYFAPESGQSYARLGLEGTSGYFASRSAAMGAVGAETVIATFYNFNPDLVRAAIPSAWAASSPAAILEARLEAADAALRRMLGDAVTSEEMGRAAGLARRAAERAGERYEGRPLFAAHAGLPWPEQPHLVLWHAQTLLREFRGDGTSPCCSDRTWTRWRRWCCTWPRGSCPGTSCEHPAAGPRTTGRPECGVWSTAAWCSGPSPPTGSRPR